MYEHSKNPTKLSLDLVLALCSYYSLKNPHDNDKSETKKTQYSKMISQKGLIKDKATQLSAREQFTLLGLRSLMSGP